MRTFVHRNLQNGLWSITQKVDGRMTVVAHVEHCELANVHINQNENMLAKIRINNRRKVCTVAEGTHLVAASGVTIFKGRPLHIDGGPQGTPERVVTFNPHIDDTMVYDFIGSKREFSTAPYAVFNAQHEMLVY